MVSFSCNACQDTLKKPKLVQHFQRCHAPFTCLDCNKEMWDGEFQKHTTCISEAEKYEKTLYKGDKKKNKAQQQQHQNKQPYNQIETKATTSAVMPVAESAPSTSAAVATAPAPASTSTAASVVPASEPAEATEAIDVPKKEKKDKKRKRKSEAEKAVIATDEADAARTSDIEVAKALVPAPAVQQTKGSDTSPVDGKTEGKKQKKRQKKSKSASETQPADTIPGGMEVDKPQTNGAVTVQGTDAKDVSLSFKDTLSKKITESGAGATLAECLAGIPTDKWQEVLSEVRVVKGKKDKLVLSL